MNNKKNTAIVFGLTKNFVFAVASVIMDLKKFNSNWIDEIVILHDGISKKQQKLLNSILPCRFVKYIFPIKNVSNFNENTLNYFSKMVFSKYECLRLLDDYHTIVWLDYDIVINQNISELVNYCESGIKMLLSDHKVLGQLHSPVQDYDMDLNGISAGTFVFQDHLRSYKEMYYFCYEKTEKYAEYLKYPEQAIFDFMIQNFKLNIDIIDKDIYCVYPDKINKFNNVKIFHAYGQRKFWNEISIDQWNRNYQNWLKMGGQKYNLNKYLIKIFFIKFFKKFGIYENIKDLILKLK